MIDRELSFTGEIKAGGTVSIRLTTFCGECHGSAALNVRRCSHCSSTGYVLTEDGRTLLEFLTVTRLPAEPTGEPSIDDHYLEARADAIRQIADLDYGADAEHVYDAIETAIEHRLDRDPEDDRRHPGANYLSLGESEKEEIDR